MKGKDFLLSCTCFGFLLSARGQQDGKRALVTLRAEVILATGFKGRGHAGGSTQRGSDRECRRVLP